MARKVEENKWRAWMNRENTTSVILATRYQGVGKGIVPNTVRLGTY